MQLQKGEGFKISNNRPHLTKDGYVRVYANRTQAENAAERVGGVAYQGLSMRFLVYIGVDDFDAYLRANREA